MKRACNSFSIKDSKIEKSSGEMEKRRTQRSLFSHKLYTSIMPDIKHPKCDHQKCVAKMQRIYKRINSTFVQCGWLCPDCSQFKKDN
jgi:hypothetical protein